MAEWLSEEEHHTWRSILRMHSQLMAELAQRLKADSDMSISDYEVLAVLSESPEGTLQARDLRCRLLWEKSRLAHHIRRMEQRGLVRRDACLTDRRAPLVAITDEGLAVIRAAAPAHVAHVRELFFDVLTPAQAAQMRTAAQTVLAHLNAREADGV